MDKYLIEVPHEATETACINAVKVFLETGSHFLANADWGCEDDEHKAWLLVDVNSKKEAEMIIPPAFRHVARITRLKKFTRKDVTEYLETGHVRP
jgi:hypothetical protein